MSGLFQRIARRDDDPDATSAPDAVEGTGPDPAAPPSDAASPEPDAPPVTDAPTQPLEPDAPPVTDAPTQQMDAVDLPDPPLDAPTPPAVAPPAAAAEAPVVAPPSRRPGFSERGRMRRRLRYLRRLRELQVRDLGGLVFDLRRFGRTREDLLTQKVEQIRACDDELHALETAIDERRDVHDVRAPGIGGTCPRCFALYGSTDHFCSTCGAALRGAVQGPAPVPLGVQPEPAAAPAQLPLTPAPPPAPAAPTPPADAPQP